MKRTIIGVTVALIFALSYAPQAEASAFMTITVGATSVTCNNTAAACGAVVGGVFTSAMGSNSISFTGTVGGYQFTAITLTSNAPGTPAVAFTLDTKTAVTNISAVTSAQVDYGVNGFTAPTGLGILSASHSGTLTLGAAGGNETFVSWERNDNALAAGPAGATAVSMTQTCTFTNAAPPVQACDGPTATLGSPTVTAPFALTSREIITTPIGSVSNWTATTALTATPVIPEPSSVLLLGTGMLILAGRLRTFRQSRPRKLTMV
jgi:hypothetical protein